MRIAVAGTGYVGLVTGACLAHVGHNVTCVDIDENKIATMKQGISPIYEVGLEEIMRANYEAKRLDYTTDYKSAYKNADVIFIGVGTPETSDGSADLGFLATVSRQIAQSIENDCVVVVKSTVPVGTNDKVEQFIKDFLENDVHVEVASNPEFLAQGTAVHDTLHATRFIIGTENERARKVLEEVYAPFNIPIVVVNRCSAEMIKYACNDFLALKISYMNDIANLCELVGADILDVAKGMSYDKRIGSSFLNAGIGYGGSCFPKDTKALKYLANKRGYRLKTVEATVEVNADQKTRLFRKASERMITYKGINVAVLGLAFKPGTDDIREAPSIDNISMLLESGANIVAYDPVAVNNFKKLFPEGEVAKGSIRYVNSPYDAIHNADICFVFTEWKEIRDIAVEEFKDKMRLPLIYDGRNIYNKTDMKSAGIEYYGIGR